MCPLKHTCGLEARSWFLSQLFHQSCPILGNLFYFGDTQHYPLSIVKTTSPSSCEGLHLEVFWKPYCNIKVIVEGLPWQSSG